jgi:hypothetical protein
MVIQDGVDPLSEQRVFAPEMPQNPSGNRRPNRSGAGPVSNFRRSRKPFWTSSAHSFLLGCRESKSFAVSVLVSAHNLGGPMQFRQAFTFSVTTQSLSVDQIVAFADAYAEGG